MLILDFSDAEMYLRVPPRDGSLARERALRKEKDPGRGGTTVAGDKNTGNLAASTTQDGVSSQLTDTAVAGRQGVARVAPADGPPADPPAVVLAPQLGVLPVLAGLAAGALRGDRLRLRLLAVGGVSVFAEPGARGTCGSESERYMTMYNAVHSCT